MRKIPLDVEDSVKSRIETAVTPNLTGKRLVMFYMHGDGFSSGSSYEPEKSHCAVIPVNQTNKEAQASAEAGERRAQMKESNAQFNMQPAPSGKRMSQGLDGVPKAAKEEAGRFTSLLHHLNVDLLRDSFYALQRKASPGLEGVTW